jgi:hypothetical protein
MLRDEYLSRHMHFPSRIDTHRAVACQPLPTDADDCLMTVGYVGKCVHECAHKGKTRIGVIADEVGPV